MKIRFAFLIGCLLLPSLTGCQSENISIEQLIESALKDAKINYSEIKHVELEDEGYVVFYITNDSLNQGIIKLDDGMLKWLQGSGAGGASLNPSKISYTLVEKNPQLRGRIFGLIGDPKIFSLQIGSYIPKIITLGDGMRIWYHFFDNGIDDNIIKGYSFEGDLVFEGSVSKLNATSIVD